MKHRDFDICFSMCKSCEFWLQDMEDERFGSCQRYAPRPVFVEDLKKSSMTCAEAKEKRTLSAIIWPETRSGDGCGDWSPISDGGSE
jgi:hypothetical protein